MDEIVENSHCDSYILNETSDIRDGCRRLLLAVKTWAYFEPPGVYDGAWLVQAAEPGDLGTFKEAFARQINQGWGNGAIWLYHSDKTPPDVWCDVQIQYVDNRDDAHLCIRVLKLPTALVPESDGSFPGFRSNCATGGNTAGFFGDNPIDMVITHRTVVEGPTDHDGTDLNGKPLRFTQFTAQHEFGHYLGCHHYCAFDSPDDENGPLAYCSKEQHGYQAHLMAKGNQWLAIDGMDAHPAPPDAWNVGQPFVSRLEKHNYTGGTITPYVAKDHTDVGGGIRDKRPWK